MWGNKKLVLSPAASGVVCSVLAVSPWTPGAGKQERSGIYLSPENAIEFAAKKLAGAPASLDVRAVSSIRNTAGAIREMRDDIPSPDHVFTLCLVFAGEDLSALRGMLKDE